MPRIALHILLSLFFLFLLAAGSSANAASLQDEASAHLAQARETLQLAGITAAIAMNGEIVWEGGAGFRDLEMQLPAEANMVHRVASISKPMTAVAIMQLYEAGKLKLEAPVQDYLPGYPQPELGTIRVEHLLAHTSGTRHYKAGENETTTRYAALNDAVALYMDRPLAFAPGTGYLYTTYGYTTLGAIIEGISGQRFEDYMREKVWGPAGMDHTGIEVFGAPVENKAKLYRINRKSKALEPDTNDDLSVKYPGGGMQSTAGDLLRFALAFESGKLLTPATRERMLTVPDYPGRKVDYALGFNVWQWKTLGKVLFHSGNQSGASSQLLIAPEKKIAVAVITNVQDINLNETQEGLTAIALKHLEEL
ncbi:MAG: beta-lactamase family protein [Candidatus Hydrogenedentes bacterium]|nr:beta-lactamase family protein [Candidatus Hydrogenedentota bacterium]